MLAVTDFTVIIIQKGNCLNLPGEKFPINDECPLNKMWNYLLVLDAFQIPTQRQKNPVDHTNTTQFGSLEKGKLIESTGVTPVLRIRKKNDRWVGVSKSS